jgi:D-3-phosphoglycerate dehydrogenase
MRNSSMSRREAKTRQGGVPMKKRIVTAGDRVYMKFFDMDFFKVRAQEADAELIPFKDFDDRRFREAIADADALILIDRPLIHEHLAVMKRCRIVLALEVGYDFIDVQAATEMGIVVSNVPVYCTQQVALHALTLLLASNRKLKTLLRETGGGGWDYNVCKPLGELEGRTLGIVGLGRIGRALVPKARGVGLDIIAYDPYLADDIFAICGVRRCYELDELLDQADFISLHVPLTEETYHMFGEREFGKMKRDALIINTCRGKVIDEKALYNGLKNSIIAGGGVDVLEKEPPDAANPLLSLENLIVTPHVAWYSEKGMERLKNMGMDEVVRVLTGRRPRFVVNPEVLFKKG